MISPTTGQQYGAVNIGASALDQANIQNLAAERQSLNEQQSIATNALSSVSARVRAAKKPGSGVGKKQLQGLVASYNSLRATQRSLADSIAQNISDTFSAEQQQVQDLLTAINDQYGTITQEQVATPTGQAQALGNYTALAKANGIDQTAQNVAQAQMGALQTALNQATAVGDPDLVAQIQQQMSQLQLTITQAVAQQLSDAMSAIQQTASTAQAKSGMEGAQAQALVAASTGGNYASAGALQGQSLQDNQDSMNAQLSAYQSMLATANSTGNVGAAATLQQEIYTLTGQLATNTQAIADNTTATQQLSINYITQNSQFSTGVYGGLEQMITTIGETTGFTDTGALKSLYTSANQSLGSTQNQLTGQLQSGFGVNLNGANGQALSGESLMNAITSLNLPQLESGMDSAQLTQFQNLIQAIIGNDDSIQANTQQLATLNGQLLQPQQWSTTAWTAFRQAIFNGMGNLMPQLAAVLPAAATPSIAPVFGSVPSGATSPTIGSLTVNHAPTPNFDSSVLGEQMAYEVANSQ